MSKYLTKLSLIFSLLMLISFSVIANNNVIKVYDKGQDGGMRIYSIACPNGEKTTVTQVLDISDERIGQQELTTSLDNVGTGTNSLKSRAQGLKKKALKFIGQLKNIEVLDLSECSSPGPTDIGIEELVGLPKLKDLNLWSTKVGDGAVEAIVKIPNLVRLNLDATKISDASMAFLPSLENLTWLHIGSTKITEKQISELYKLSKLKYLNLSFTEASFSDAVDEIYEKLKEATSEGCEIVGL